jgi:nitrate reductase NapE component
MELALNLTWIVLATLMYWLWTRYASSEGADRREQLVALVLVILILFPVISVTDDLITAQYPAETDCCQRKDHVFARTHTTLHPVPEFIVPYLATLSTGSILLRAPGHLFDPMVTVPALDSIQNRPPPRA